jgi:hypothetical protein
VYVKIQHRNRRVQSQEVVPFAHERGAATLKAQLTHRLDPVVLDVPGSPKLVYEQFIEEIWLKGGGACDVAILAPGDRFGQGLVRGVRTPTGGLCETIVDCVPYCQVTYAVALGQEALLGVSSYKGVAEFLPLGNGVTRVSWRAEFSPYAWWCPPAFARYLIATGLQRAMRRLHDVCAKAARGR